MLTLSECDDFLLQIEGDILAVKKGLVAVSQCLQDCKLVDKSKTTGSRHTEAVPQETLPDLHADYFSRRNFVVPTLTSSSINFISSINLPSSSVSYTSGLRPLTIESERLPTVDTKVQVQLQVQDVVFKLLCANDKIGGVIGKGGSIVKALQSETGANISVGATVAECDDRLITITASEVVRSVGFSTTLSIFILVAKSGVCVLILLFCLLCICRTQNHGTLQHKKQWFLFSPSL